VLFLWSALIFRAAYVQFVPDARLEKLMAKQFESRITLASRRGSIFDKNGKGLAVSTNSYSVFVDPKLIENRKLVIQKLSSLLSISAAEIKIKIQAQEKRFVWIKRQVDESAAIEIKSLKLKGVQVVDEFKRAYPNETLLSQTLGRLGSEGQGLEGLEFLYNTQLQGNQKKIQVKRDARGRPLIVDGLLLAESPEGKDITLTIDRDVQFELERELNNAVLEFNANHAVGVILDAKTSAILALANVNNKLYNTESDFFRNRVVSDTNEPGSTIKTFVIATALQKGKIQPNTRFDTGNGQMQIGKRIIREAESSHRWPQLTVSEILAYSSNVGTSRIALQLGENETRQGLLNFGFAEKTQVELPGEGRGKLQNLPWSDHLLANVSFGHGMTATALQVANAYAVIANGGVLNKPYLIQSIFDPETQQQKDFKPEKIRQVISSEVAMTMRLMLAGVTAEGGTGVNARVNGFPVAGKTGTAQKAMINGRGYEKGAYLSSFAGFLPANDPQYVIYVSVDQPRDKSFYGSQVAAPVFSRVASYLARQMGMAPVLISDTTMIEKKAVAERRVSSFDDFKAKNRALSYDNSNVKNSTDLEQQIAGTNLNQTTMPNVLGKNLRLALEDLAWIPLDVKVQGQGTVVRTEPSVGTPLDKNQSIRIFLE